MNPQCKGHYAEPGPMAETLGRWPALIASTEQGAWEARRAERGLSRLERSKQWPDVLPGTEASEAKPHGSHPSRAGLGGRTSHSQRDPTRPEEQKGLAQGHLGDL